MPTNIEQLQTRVEDTKNQIEQAEGLSQAEKLEKAKDLESVIDAIKSDLYGLKKDATPEELLEITKLGGELDNLNAKFKIAFKTQLDALEKEVHEQKKSDKKKEESPEEEESRIGKQFKGLTSKDEWKNHTVKNITRVVSGLGVVRLGSKLIKGIKSLFNKETENTGNIESKTPSRKKFLILTGVIGGTTGISMLGYKYWPQIKGWFLDLIGGNLTFEEAIIKVKSDLGGVSESDMNIALGLEYIEQQSSIKSYGEKIEIDKKNKSVKGLDVTFSNFEEMIHAANIINYAKATYKGKCVSDTPFYITGVGGDIEVHLLDDYKNEVISGEGVQAGAIAGGVIGSIGALAAGYFLGPKAGAVVGLGSVPAGIIAGHYLGDGRSTLAKICPSLAKGIGKKKLCVCLNSLPDLTQGNQTLEPDNKTPLQKDINKVIIEMRDTETDAEFNQHGNARKLHAEVDPDDPTVYTISSWGRGSLGETKVKFIEGKSIKIEGLDIEFTDIKEGIRVANLINKIKHQYAGKLTSNPFSYKSGFTTLGNAGLYASDKGLVPNRVISKEMLEYRYPKLLIDIETKYIPYLHKFKTEYNSSLWINPN